VPDNSEAHKSFQNFVSSVGTFIHVSLPGHRIWKGLLDVGKFVDPCPVQWRLISPFLMWLCCVLKLCFGINCGQYLQVQPIMHILQ